MTYYDSRGEPIQLRSDPGLVCSYCGFDNNPGMLADVPDACEGCGAEL